MYHPPPTHSRHNSLDHDRRPSREHMGGGETGHGHQYPRPSPGATPPAYSPTNGGPPPSPRYPYASARPSTAHGMSVAAARSPPLGPPQSPRSKGPGQGSPGYAGGPRGPSQYYDPTAEHREAPPVRASHIPALESPTQPREAPSFANYYSEQRNSPPAYQSAVSFGPHHSPTHATHHGHPPTRHDSYPRSPMNPSLASPIQPPSQAVPPVANGVGATASPHAATSNGEMRQRPVPLPEEKPPTRTANPMAFSSILSDNTSEPPKDPYPVASPPGRPRKTSGGSQAEPHPVGPANGPPAGKLPATPTTTHSPVRKAKKTKPRESPDRGVNGIAPKAAPSLSDKENENIQKETDKIDAMPPSPLDAPGWEVGRSEYDQVCHERRRTVNVEEQAKRRRRREATTRSLLVKFEIHARSGRKRFRDRHEEPAREEVDRQDKVDEKERKKDMQRKRRRERTMEQAVLKQQNAMKKASSAVDHGQRQAYIKEAQKAEKKARTTKRTLEQGDVAEDLREVTPIAPNLEGGTMSIFQTASHLSPEPPRKKVKGMSTRPKKSKEQKLSEKAKAEAGQILLDNNELPQLAPKGESRREVMIRESKSARRSKDASPALTQTNYDSKGFLQIYDQIMKDIARKDVPKVYRIKDNSYATKASNLRKTAQLAGKEGRRWQLKTNKGMKDTQARAKRGMREMMSFWKRNERVERDMRRVAEKQELENAKKAEADREANRQKRKLNFLISQTELYSHFIGRKIKTDEVERSTDDATVAASDRKIQPGKTDAHAVELPSDGADGTLKVTNFEDLDFDADDETALRQAASANAQAAVQEAQDRARAFNNETDDIQAQMDDGEMNFQNPSGIDNLDVPQPKMLNCQLKEYQLKGLNWLVNLYEQGINGILADEMGLGKTVQSISVMAYLAEKHNIWGPFLVIAPSSTLHNWQQEITRFVPDLKCLPYWGSAKDRKVLRKFWDRKHITYTKESPFHCLITSYQLVVQDAQYFQKIRWQYMILDEAQAIKSSQSSRWKSLLGFHCRNRLLLTGTPIQNNMQELWALLHFIMPSLFDSHDEFSDWFSKDIESHAQSNTKLNEDQLKRLHLILKPFMLRRVKKHVQKELGDKVEKDVYCDLTYRQRAYYGNLRSRISIMDLLEKAAVGDDQDAATLMNLVMQFRKVCNHPDLFERAETTSPMSLAHWAECASFLREGNHVHVDYSTRNVIEYDLPRFLDGPDGRVDVAGPGNSGAGFRRKAFAQMFSIWTPENILRERAPHNTFSWLPLVNESMSEVGKAARSGLFERALSLSDNGSNRPLWQTTDSDGGAPTETKHHLLRIPKSNARGPLADIASEGYMRDLLNISRNTFDHLGLENLERCARPGATAPPIQISCSNQAAGVGRADSIFNLSLRKALYGLSEKDEQSLIEARTDPRACPPHGLLPEPLSQASRYTNIDVPSMRRFVTDSGKLGKLDKLLRELKNGGHRVLLYFQMTRMINLMEEYLTYRNYKYCRLDGSTKLEDRRDTVHDFQTRPEIFVFLLSTRAGGLGINLTAADTVIFYDSDWNPTIDSQAMDRAHRLGQTRQVTVYRMITRGTIEERIRKRALQKEEVQRVVISGGGGAGVDFNTRSKDNRTKDVMMWLADDDQAKLIEQKEKEAEERGEQQGKKGKKGKAGGGRKKDVSLDDMYHEGEGHFGDEASNKPSGAATPMEGDDVPTPLGKRAKGTSKKAKTLKQKLAVADGL